MGSCKKVDAFRRADNPKHQQYTQIWLLCNAAQVSLPVEVKEYFHGCRRPEDALKIPLRERLHYQPFTEDDERGIEIILGELPEGIHKIRVLY